MRNLIRTHRLFARTLVTLLTWALLAGQALPVYAQLTPLGDVPIAAKVAAKPNIVYTLDDSGSMQMNYTPDYVASVGATVTITTITRVGLVATATGVGANSIAVGDYVTVAGASPPEYNGYFLVVTKPSGSSFTYNMLTVPATSPATVAAGYANKVVVTSAAYCRSGNGTAACAPQATNISSAGSTVAITSITRAPGVGPVLATATGTLANFQQLSTGDTVLIAGATGTSIPYNGVYTITVTSATTFTYTITATTSVLPPLTSVGSKTFTLSGGSAFAAPPLHAADFNRLAYNPNVTYLAPLKADGTPLTNSGTDANGNYGTTATFYSTPTVDRDPFASYEVAAGVTPMWSAATKDNLNLKMAVPLYCNTDWPILVNDIYYPSGPNGATARDAGTTDGQYSAGTGGWCRINGTAYDASVASGAPAAVADYNYPWQSSSGAKGAQYFYQQLSVKTLWCDTTSPNWPRNGVIVGCTLGGMTTGGSTQPQSCYQTGTPNVCTGSYPTLTYKSNANPTIFCDNSATYCSQPGVGSSPECQACTCVPNTPSKVAACHLTSTGLGGSGANCGCTGTGCVLGTCPNFVTNPTGCTTGNPIYGGPATSANCTSFLWDPVAGVYTSTTLLTDAGAPGTTGALGTTCRHNNYTYATGGAAGLFKYNAVSTYVGEGASGLGKFNLATTGGCPAVATTVGIPRHYYVIDSVDFCSDRIVTADVQWKGFGTGTCPSKTNDLANNKEIKYGQFTRVDMFAGNAVTFPGNSNFVATQTTPFPYDPKYLPGGPRVWLAASPTPANSESVNYANWYAYYSTRLNAAKTTSSIGFSFLTASAGDPIAYRVGFHNLGEEPATYGGAGTPIIWADVKDWDLTQRTSWYGKLFGIAVLNYKTPTIDAMLRIGNLFETGGASGLPASVNPLPSGTIDPIARDALNNPITCQNNYHILFTDGVTNQVTPTTYVGDQDATIPTFLTTVPHIVPDQVLPTLSLGGAWPAPFVQGTAVPNTLADIATRYWANDLRPSLTNNVPSESSAGTGDVFFDPATGKVKDVAWWQHVNFSAIAFGAAGTLDPSNQGATLSAIKAGTLSWPNLTQPNNPVYPHGAAAGAVAIDDLWHATLMARGTFVFAKSPQDVSYGIAGILAGIQNQRKSRSGAAFNGQVLDANNDIIFEPTIEVGWAGDLLKVEIDPATGATVTTPPSGIWWQASKTLAAQIDPVVTGTTEPWMSPTYRRIVTLANNLGTGNRIPGPGVPFQYANLLLAPVGPAMLNSLAPSTNTTLQQEIIAYLRGGNTFNSGAVIIEGTGQGQFRQRFGRLGDISNAQPVIIGPPQRNYTDAGYGVPPKDSADTGSGFAGLRSSRTTVVVAAANDGMVHVFDAGPMPKAATDIDPAVPVSAGGGNEIFAYIPRALFRGIAGSASTEDGTGIQALTYQDGGAPIYHHHQYVDSSPRAGDIDILNGVGTPADGSSWRSIVVGGLGKGGNSYYALNLTDVSSVPDETTAATKVLWEWTNPDADVGPGARIVTGGNPGYSFGHPLIVKVRESGYPTGRSGRDCDGWLQQS